MTIPTAVLDLSLDKIATSTRVSYLSGIPANFAGIAAVSLGSKVISGASFAKAAGDTSGRKLTLEAQTAITPSGNGIVCIQAHDDGTTMLNECPCGPVVTTGTAQAGATTSLTLAAGASASDDAYNGYLAVIVSGAGAGGYAVVTDYVGSTKVATVAAWQNGTPNNTSVYEIRGQAVTTAQVWGVAATKIAEVRAPIYS